MNYEEQNERLAFLRALEEKHEKHTPKHTKLAINRESKNTTLKKLTILRTFDALSIKKQKNG